MTVPRVGARRRDQRRAHASALVFRQDGEHPDVRGSVPARDVQEERTDRGIAIVRDEDVPLLVIAERILQHTEARALPSNRVDQLHNHITIALTVAINRDRSISPSRCAAATAADAPDRAIRQVHPEIHLMQAGPIEVEPADFRHKALPDIELHPPDIVVRGIDVEAAHPGG